MNQKTTFFLAIGLLLCGAAVFWAQKDKEKEFLKPAGPAGAARPLFDPKPTDIVKVEMVAWGKPAMVFEKTDDNWRMIQPLRAPAAKYQVDNQVNRVTGLQSSRAYAAGDKDRPSDEATKCKDQPAWVFKLTDKAGKTFAVRIGQSVLLSSDTYVQVEGDDKVHIVKGDLNSEFKSGLDEYRDKQIAQFTTTDATRISLSGAQSLTLAKSPDGKWTIEQPVRARADSGAVTSLLSAIANASVQKFVADAPKSLSIYGLDNPRLTVTVETEKRKLKPPPPGSTQPATQPEFETEKKTVTLCFGAVIQQEGAGKVFAKLGGADTPWVFQLPDSTLTQAAPDLTKLRDKAVAQVDTLRASKIKLAGGAGTVELEKKDGLWRIIAPAELAGIAGDNRAEFAAVDDLLKAIRDLKATDFESADSIAGDYGFDDKAIKVEISTEGSLEPAQITVGKATPQGTGIYIRNDREGAVAVVKADSIGGLKVQPMSFVSRKLLAFPKEQVEKLEIECDGVTRSVSKLAGLWKLAAPVSAAAETKAVTDCIADLASLDARTIVGAAPDLVKFGLDKPAVRCHVTVQPPPHPSASQPATSPSASQPASAPTMVQDPPTVHTLVAAKVGGKAYIFIEGGTRIGEVDDKIFRDLAAEMHEHKVAQLDTSKLNGVELKYPDRTLNFEKKGDDWTLEREPGFRGDATKVKAVADALRDLTTEKYVDFTAADLAKYKLDNPAITLTVRIEGGTTHALRIAADGPAGDDAKRRYATLAGSNKVFLAAAADAAKFEKQIKDFESGGAAPATPAAPPAPSMPQMPPDD